MDLDGLFRDTEMGSDLLVEQPGAHQGKYLALARGTSS